VAKGDKGNNDRSEYNDNELEGVSCSL